MSVQTSSVPEALRFSGSITTLVDERMVTVHLSRKTSATLRSVVKLRDRKCAYSALTPARRCGPGLSNAVEATRNAPTLARARIALSISLQVAMSYSVVASVRPLEHLLKRRLAQCARSFVQGGSSSRRCSVPLGVQEPPLQFEATWPNRPGQLLPSVRQLFAQRAETQRRHSGVSRALLSAKPRSR